MEDYYQDVMCYLIYVVNYMISRYKNRFNYSLSPQIAHKILIIIKRDIKKLVQKREYLIFWLWLGFIAGLP
jgi:tmRNA-binding protein